MPPVKLSFISGSIVAFQSYHSRTSRSIVVLLTVLQVGALQRIVHDVEEKRIVEDLEDT